MKYDVCIIGAGPAGMFAAYELSKETDLSITIFEKGKDVQRRKCPTSRTFCHHCTPCNIMSGVGGAGTLSSGLLNLSPDIGGEWSRIINDKEQAWDLIHYIDDIFLRFGVPNQVFGTNEKDKKDLERRAAAAGIKYIPQRQRHIGTENTPKVISSFKKDLESKGVHFVLETEVKEIKRVETNFHVYSTEGDKNICRYLIAAPGRIGANWLSEQAKELGILSHPGPIDIGVRVELPSIVFDPVVKVNLDPKFYIQTSKYDDFIRTFCLNHKGYVVQEYYDGFIGVNGHAYDVKKSGNTNFAFLVRIELTEPLEDTSAYGRSIAIQTTTLGGGKPILQRVEDLRNGRRSTWTRIERSHVEPTLKDVTPGDIAMAMPHRIVTDILEGLEKLDTIIPGVASSSTLLYAPEIKFYANKIQVNQWLETNIENFFVAGDGAGLSRGIVAAAATGTIAARGIVKKEEK